MPHLRREAQSLSAAQSSSHTPDDPMDRVGTDQKGLKRGGTVGIDSEGKSARAGTMGKARVTGCPSPFFSISGALRSP